MDKKNPVHIKFATPNGAGGVPVDKVLTATFSEEMKPATLPPVTVTADNGVAVAVSYAAGPPSAATITPTERLACNTTHTVAIGAGGPPPAGHAARAAPPP